MKQRAPETGSSDLIEQNNADLDRSRWLIEQMLRAETTDRATRSDLVVLDELGYLPFSQAGGALLFHLLSKLYEHTGQPPDERGEVPCAVGTPAC